MVPALLLAKTETDSNLAGSTVVYGYYGTVPTAFSVDSTGALNTVAASGSSYTGAVPTADSADNAYVQDVVGNKIDGPSGNSLISLSKTNWAVNTGIDNNVDAVLLDTGTTIPGTITTLDGKVVTNWVLLTGLGENLDSVLVDTGTTLPAQIAAGFSETTGAIATQNETIEHIPMHAGEVWYANSLKGLDTNDGMHPDTAFETFSQAMFSCATDDLVIVAAGTYAENVVISKEAIEIRCEIGTIISPPTGTGIEVTGNYCKILGQLVIITPASESGLLVSGTSGYFEKITCSGGDINFEITGANNTFFDCIGAAATATSFSIGANNTSISGCDTAGIGASYGYKVIGGADYGVIKNNTSSGHTIAGYYIDTGSIGWTMLNDSSGGGDGPKADIDTANVWSHYLFNNICYKTITFTGVGGASINLFRVYGTVLVTALSGEIETNLAADVGLAYLQLDDGTNQIDVTDSPGPDFSSIPAHSYLHKIDDAAVQIAIELSTQVRLYEDATKDGRDPSFLITAKEGSPTYLRLTYAGNGASGAIHWHLEFDPQTEDGNVTVAP